jgi:EamA domain-containing membrane protein RarD
MSTDQLKALEVTHTQGISCAGLLLASSYCEYFRKRKRLQIAMFKQAVKIIAV